MKNKNRGVSVIGMKYDQEDYNTRSEQGKKYLRTKEHVRVFIFQLCNLCNC